MKIYKIKGFLIDALFPKFCLNCGKEGDYLCSDCLSLIDVLEYSSCLKLAKLNGVFFAVSYEDKIIKKLIRQFKYKPFVRDLAKTLASLIITHFYLLNNIRFLLSGEPVLMPVPLDRKKIKMRGFNQSEEIAKQLSQVLKIPLARQGLITIKETQSQTELSKKQRKENIKNAFACKNIEEIKNKKILLIDDVFTTGATLEECAKVLKSAGAKEVWGITVAREP
ncbi:ComF family protein [Candidatus Parcubacteria bacterium]|nr:ComF family protein [Candidatus Parcubacteria bacterium]